MYAAVRTKHDSMRTEPSPVSDRWRFRIMGHIAACPVPLIFHFASVVFDADHLHKAYRPLNRGGRFSRKDALPSRTSSVWRQTYWA